MTDRNGLRKLKSEVYQASSNSEFVCYQGPWEREGFPGLEVIVGIKTDTDGHRYAYETLKYPRVPGSFTTGSTPLDINTDEVTGLDFDGTTSNKFEVQSKPVADELRRLVRKYCRTELIG
jgi:hypothetical protein